MLRAWGPWEDLPWGDFCHLSAHSQPPCPLALRREEEGEEKLPRQPRGFPADAAGADAPRFISCVERDYGGPGPACLPGSVALYEATASHTSSLSFAAGVLQEAGIPTGQSRFPA